MQTNQIAGAKIIQISGGSWELQPSPLGDVSLSIDATEISKEIEERAEWIIKNWSNILARCYSYIEENRTKYELIANPVGSPDIFISDGSEWAVYFGTDHEIEAVLGVDFNGDDPLQLVIGD